MPTFSSRKSSSVLLASFVLSALSIGLAACTSAPVQDEASTDYAKVASADLRDIEFCFHNKSATSVTITWPETPLNSTHDGSGTLDQGEQICGEGPGAIGQVNFQDGFATYVWGFNTYFTRPSVKFQTLDNDPEPQVYANDTYKIGQTITTEIKGHTFVITRLDDDAWINFTVDIK